MQSHMLAPAAALVCWSLVVMLWMAFTRFPVMAKLGIEMSKLPPGGRGSELQGVAPDSVMWKSHNYTHLMEQPTIFYPTVVILAIVGATTTDVWLAWAYVAVRVVHSIWQCTINRLPVRASLFFLSSLILITLAIRAMIATLYGTPAALI